MPCISRTTNDLNTVHVDGYVVGCVDGYAVGYADGYDDAYFFI
jgi:hypothetical protein